MNTASAIIIGSLAIFGGITIIVIASVAIGDALTEWYNRGR